MRRRGEFTTAVRHGRRAGRPALVVHLYDGAGAGTPRIGFIVSRSVGSAVARNLVRRRLRHLLRGRLADLPAGALVVVRLLPPAADLPGAELAAELDRALSRAASGSNRAAAGGTR
jgi:ribonuclease P protein component